MFDDLFDRLRLGELNRGVSPLESPGHAAAPVLRPVNPASGIPLPAVQAGSPDDYDRAVARATEAFRHWRTVPAPRRGEVVRQIGEALRARKADLGLLITLETGKIRSEGEGEVQEMIDIAEFVVGQSRLLHGLSMHSERPQHRMSEQWHPLGVVGIITAFNFPVAVWAWNACPAAICGIVS